ncbi:MAG: B12-binding domain-containing radical SAM protein [Nitrospirae bacterium]|nr:B12-binding domain-containing radical SAM protein [Nitrospirota bacterium]
MKILLVRHPTTHFKHTAPPVSGLPLGLLYIAASCRQAGHQVQIYDAIVAADEDRWGYYESDGDLCRMGATESEIRKIIEEINPDVVGIGNQYSSQATNALIVAQAAKKVNREIRVIVGGPHATVMPSTFFSRDSSVDYAVMGEGEATIVDLLNAMGGRQEIQTVKGVAYLDEGKLIINEKRNFIDPLDDIPLPAYDLLDMERYFYFNGKGKDGRETYGYQGSERSVSMITSRGCPFNCIFCSIHLGMGRKFRAHSVNHVLEHIKLLKESYGINHLHFEDDNLSFDISRFRNIIDGMIAAGQNITWDTPNGVRADFLNEDILERCKTSGCTYLRVGVESANEYVSREIVRKRLDLDKVIEIAKSCNRIGIDLEAFYIIGFPGENIYQMRETIDFAVRQERTHGLYPYGMFTATPLIGTDLYKVCQGKGYLSRELSPENLATATQGQGMITTEDFNSEDLKKLLINFKIRHNIARVIFSFRFMIKHPGYFLIRLKDKSFMRRMITSLLKFELRPLIAEFFLYRYKNCVVRKVGIK